jgi:hypothetical protein
MRIRKLVINDASTDAAVIHSYLLVSLVKQVSLPPFFPLFSITELSFVSTLQLIDMEKK